MKQYVSIFGLAFLLMFLSVSLFSQVSINTDGSQPDPSAMLDVKSAIKGFLPPRVELTSPEVAAPVATPVAIGLLVFNTAANGTAPNNVVPGYYYWNGTRWVAVTTPQGLHPGEMLFWNGVAWVTIPQGAHGQQLYFCDGLPSWGGCHALVIADSVTNITFHSALSGGKVISDGGSPVISRGVCWSTSPDPTILDSKTNDGSGTGSFTSTLTGLNPNTKYFMRAYATNNIGTAYAYHSDTSFTTSAQIDAPVATLPFISSCAGVVVDIPVTVASFNSIRTISLTLNYNSSALTYTGATNTSGFPGLIINGTQSGKVTINGASGQGVTLQDNSVLLTMHFSYNGGLTDLEWFDNGTSCEYQNGELIVLNDSPTTAFYQNGQVNEIVEVGTPVFSSGPESVRCQGAGTESYIAVAVNSTSISYSLDALSVAAGNVIDPSTGLVTFTGDWVGTSVITASAEGCNGPKTAEHTVTVNQVLPFSVVITSSANSICAGTEVTLTASTSNGGPSVSYQWKLNGSPVGVNSDSFTFVPASNDAVSLVATSDAACISGNPATSNTLVMVVNPLLPVSATITPSANSICAGNLVTYNATSSNGGSLPAYQWQVNGINAGTNSAVFAYVPVQGDVVTCIVTSNAACVSGNPATSNAVPMSVFPLLPVSVSIVPSANSLCAGVSVTFSATAINGGLTPAYQWKVNGVNVGTNSDTFTYAPANDDHVTCVLTSSLTCTNGNPATSNTVIMAVNPVHPVSVSIAPSANPVCAGTTVTFNAIPVNGGTQPNYQWMVNGNNTGSGSSTFSYIPVHNEVVSCVLTSDATCVSGNPATSNAVVMTVNPLLPVSVSVSASANPVCFGSQVTYTAVAVNGGPSPFYQWKVNEIPTGTNNPVFTYLPSNNDAVTCTVASNATCASGNPATSAAVVMTVNPLLPVSVTIAPSANSICEGATVTFTATPLNGGTNPVYQWNVNSSNTGPNSATFTYIPGNNDVVLCVLTSDEACTGGNPATSNTVQMTVNPLMPVSVVIAPSANQVCDGTLITFNATPVNGGASPTYQWMVNGTNTGSGGPVFSYIPENNDVVSCQLTSDAACVSGNPAISNIVNMTIYPLLPVSVTISASSNPVCSGAQVTFTASAGNGGSSPTYQWKVNGNNSGTSSPVFSYVPANNDAVTCTVYSNETCVSGNPATSEAVVIIVNPLLPVSVSIVPSANSVCAGTTVTYTAAPVNGGANPVYQWSVNGAITGANNASFSYIPADGDNVLCVLASSEACTSGNPATSNMVQMIVNPLLPVNVVITPSANQVCAGTTVVFTAIPANGGAAPSYQWKVNGSNAGDNNPVYSYVPVNNDVVTCLLTSDATCATGNPASSNIVNMTVYPLLPVGVSISASSNPVCSGSQVTFTASVVNGGITPTYLWKVNGNNTGTNSPVFSYTPANGDAVTCTVTSSEACVSGNPVASEATVMTVNPLLPVSVTIVPSANSVCAGTTVTYTATPVNGGTNPGYQWKVNDANAGTNSSSFAYAPANNDVVSCILTSGEACTSGNPAVSNSVQMAVNPLLPVSVSVSPSENPVCAGTTVTFTAVPINGGAEPFYQWSVNGTNAGLNSSTYAFIPADNDAVSCILTSDATCASGSPASSNIVTMTVNSLQPVSVSVSASSNPVCFGAQVTYTASAINGGTAPIYQWKVNGNNAGTSNPVYSYVPGHNDLVTCTVTSNAPCASGNPATSDGIMMTVNPVFPVSVSIVASASIICAGTAVTFTATPVNGGSLPVYQWSVNGSNAGPNSDIFIYTPANGDVVTCSLTSNETCTSGNPATSNAISLIVNPILPVSITIVSSGNPVCAGTSVTYTATPINGGTAPAYQWNVNGSVVNGATNVTYQAIPANGNVITCVLTSSETCTSGNPATSNAISMIVNPLLPVSVTITASANPVCAGTSVTYTASPANGGTTPGYQWNLNGTPVNGATDATYTMIPVNGDVVTCTLTSSEGCTTGNPATSPQVIMSVNPLLPVSVAITTPSNPVCAGTSVTYTATPVNGGSAPEYQWKVNGADVAGATNVTYSSVQANSNSVSCKLTSNASCASGNPALSNLIDMTVNPLLPVSVSVAASANPVCTGALVTLTATPVNGGASPAYQWNLNGTPINGATNATYTYMPVNGNIISCALTSSEACTTGNPAASNQVTITVNPLLPVNITVAASANPVCAGTSVTFTATPVNGGTSPAYQWNVNGTNVNGATNSAYTFVPTNGNVVTCVLLSSETCTTGNPATAAPVTMTVNPTLPVSITIVASANPVCAGTSVTYTATPVNGGTLPGYQWKVNGTNVPGATNATYTHIPVSGNTISCALTSNATCPTDNPALSNVISMVVNPLLPVSVTIAASANPVCAGTPVIYTATPVNGGTLPAYQWKLNGTNVSGATNVTYNFTPSNGNVITCVMTSSETCTTGNPDISNEITMTVNPMLPVSVSISASINPACAGTTVIFTAIPVNGGTTPGYQWKVNGASVTGATNATYSLVPGNGNVITCVLTSSEVCTTGNPATSNAVTMTVNPLLPVSVTIAASATTVCAGISVTLTATPVNGGTSPLYQWRVNGTNVTGATNSSYTLIPANGNAVTCVMTSSETCTTGNPATSNVVTLTVNPLLPVSVGITASANPVCAGSTVTYTAVPVNGGTTPSYQWKVDGEVVPGATNSTYSNVPTDGEIITCVLTSSESCTTGNPALSSSLTMTVNPILPASVTIAASSNPVCSGTSVTFTATPVNGGTQPTYQWKVNGNVVAGATNVTYSYVPVQNDVVLCIMTSTATCVSGSPATSNSITMTVNTSVPVSVSIVASVYAVMPGTQVTFTATPVNGGSLPAYQWKVNGTAVGTNSNTYAYAPANNDKVTCVLTSNLTGCTTNNPATSNQIVIIVYVTGSACSGTPTVSYGGLTYNTVQVGTQCWLRENINLGNMINGNSDQTNNSILEKYCYNNIQANCNVYGGLYQWAEMVQYLNNATNTTNWSPVPTGNVQGICPAGWHIPSNTEWGALMTYLGGINVTGGKLKQVGTNHFNAPNTGATNSSGFTAIPGGQRWSDFTFHYMNMSTAFWTITSGGAGTDIYYGGASYSINAATNGQFYKNTGISVRCLKD